MVKPLDLQDNFSKAPLASRAQQAQQDGAETARRQANLAGAQHDQAAQRRTESAKAADRGDIRPDGRDWSGGKKKKRQAKKQSGRRRKTSDDETPGNDDPHIDILA